RDQGDVGVHERGVGESGSLDSYLIIREVRVRERRVLSELKEAARDGLGGEEVREIGPVRAEEHDPVGVTEAPEGRNVGDRGSEATETVETVRHTVGVFVRRRVVDRRVDRTVEKNSGRILEVPAGDVDRQSTGLDVVDDRARRAKAREPDPTALADDVRERPSGARVVVDP